MISDKEFYFHVGLPKTGTTFLQQRFFSILDGIYYACSAEPFNRSLGLFFEELAYANPTFYPLEKKRLELEEILSKIENKKILISCEELFGWFHLNFANNAFVADTLYRLIPNARLIIILRRQSDWLESAYKQTLRQFSSETFNEFLRFRDGTFETRRLFPGRPQINVEQLSYQAYVRNYARLFGKENLLILPFEIFQQQQSQFLFQLSDFMNVTFKQPLSSGRVNQGYSLITSYLARILNRFVISEYHGQGIVPEQPFYQYFKEHRHKNQFFRLMASLTSRLTLNTLLEHGLDKIFYIPVRFIDPKQQQLIHEMHQSSNRQLDEEFNIGLDAFGYY